MSYRNNYTENWEEKGYDGARVAQIILDGLSEHGTALNSHEEKINNNIKDIQFEVDSTTSTVTCKVIKGNNTVINGTVANKHLFTLKAVSNDTATLNIANYSDLSTGNVILKYGLNFSFDYDWEVRNSSGNKRANATGKLLITIVDLQGNSITYDKGEAPITKTGTNTPKTAVILADELPEGTNLILVRIQGTYNGATIYSDQLDFKLNILNPRLTVSFDENDGINKLRDLNELFNWNFSVTDSKGKALKINNSPVTDIIKLFYYGYTPSVSTVNNSEKWSISNIRGTSSLLIGRLKVYVLAEIRMGSTVVKSNTVLLYFMGNNAITADYTWYAILLDNVLDISSGAPTIKALQYDSVNFPVQVYSKVENKLTYSLSRNGIDTQLTTRDINSEELVDCSYSYIFKTTGKHTFKIFDQYNNSLDIIVDVESLGASIGELTSLVINLNASGKTQSDHTWKYNSYEVEFDGNFDWAGNGWVDDGLLLNNGSTAIINYCPFSTGVFTASFKINAQNSINEERLVSCVSGNTGFEIFPEKATFLINGTGISTEFNSTLTHEITFVRYGDSYGNLIVIYIDGLALLAKAISDNVSSLNCPIVMSSINTLCYIYNINIFSLALSFTNVLAVYCFNKTNSEDIVNYIKANDVFYSGANMSSIGYNNGQAITPESLPVGSRYLIISEYNNAALGAIKCEDPSPWKTIDEYPGAEAEKYKGIYHLVGNVLFIEKVAQGENPSPRNFLVDKATLAALGTSSMAYPLKNFRLAFKKPINEVCPYYNASPIDSTSSDPKAGDFGFTKYMYTGVAETDWIETKGTATDYTAEFKGSPKTPKSDKLGKAKYPIRSKSDFGGEDTVNSAEAAIFCLKADYAESSGSHNTGYARLVNEALTNSSNIYPNKETCSILPLLFVVNSKGSSATYKKEIRSTIDGFPVYLFFKTVDGDIIYHGKYNFNNEKSSKDVFGFEKITDYFDNSIVKNESTLLKRLFNDTNDYYDATHFKYGFDKDGKFEDDETKASLNYVNPIECWEFSNNTFDVEPTNQNVIGAFNFPYTDTESTDGIPYPKKDAYPNLNPFKVKDGEGLFAWLSLAWEYRYPGLDDGSAGDLLYKNGNCKPFLLDSIYKWLYKHNGTLINFDNLTLNDFAENLHKYFNVNYLLKYYVLTKWFGNVDQRVKNCMLSFYCDPTVQSNEDPDSPMGHMRAFYIFYDNDTILGVDNAGTLTLDWDIDEDVYPSYGKHAIWDNLEYCYNYYVSGRTEFLAIALLGELILSAYLSVRKVITNNKITKYFDTDQVNKFSDAVHNLDAEVKYFYAGDLNSTSSNFASANIAKFLGNRRFHRERWIFNRTNWLDAKFKAGDIDLYSYQFKVGGTSGTTLPGGTIKLTSAFKNWRFHITDSTSKLKISSPLLAKGSSYNMPITANSFSISDFVLIEALYGCSEIDFTNFETSTWFLDLSNGGKSLPYVKIFTLNSKENTTKPKIFSSAAFEKLLTTSTEGGKKTTIFPNLEELNICNTLILVGNGEGSTRLPGIDLSTFGKLSKVDLTGTVVDVILPNSSLLLTLILESPTTLNITNKPNLTKIEIGINELTSLTAGPGNSSYAYDWLLNTAKNKKDYEDFTANIVMGSRDLYYHVSNTQIELLISLVEASNVLVKGYLYNPSISNEHVDLLTTRFPELVISTSNSTSIEFRLSESTLREGSSISINLISGLLESPNDWYWAVYDDTLKLFVRNSPLLVEDTENKTRTKLILSAPLSGQNNNITYRLRVGAYYDNSEDPILYENEIPVLYIAVNKITLNAESLILDEDKSTVLSFTCSPSNHTKLDWIKNNADWSGVLNGSVNGNTLIFTKIGLDDAQVKVTVQGIISNTLTIFYDRTLASISEVKEESIDNSLRWIYNLMYDKHGINADLLAVKVSELNRLTLTSAKLSLLSYNYDDGLGNTTLVPQDLTYLLYCKYTDPQFTIPGSLYFTDIVLPSIKGLTSVIWNPNIELYYNYGTIVFPEYMDTALITINTDTNKLNNLTLDFSKTSITKIYNGGGSCENKAASVLFTYNLSVAGTTPDHSIFIYPTTLTTLGNYVEKNNWTSTYLAIFNLNGVTPSTVAEFAPLYQIASCSTLKKLGPLYNYKVQNNYVSLGVAFEQTSENITHLYLAFKNGNLPHGAEDLQEFSDLLQIGNSSFENTTIQTLTLGLNITDIGDLAFMGFDGILRTLESTDLPETLKEFQVFSSVKTIGDYAFAGLTNNLKVEFNNLVKVGQYAFATKADSGISHEICIKQTTPFEFKSTSFGSDNIVYMPLILITELSKSTEWEGLSKNVTINTL